MAFTTAAEGPSVTLNEMLPTDMGRFRQVLSMRPLVRLAKEGLLSPDTFRTRPDSSSSPYVGGETEYLSSEGKFTVELLKFNEDSDAYSFFTLIARRMGDAESAKRSAGAIGIASVESPHSIAFVKGSTFVRITPANSQSKALDGALQLAHLFADRINNGEGDVPVLLKHLPEWESVRANAIYFVSPQPLKAALGSQPVLDAISFEGGTEAVAATYGSATMVIAEFTTPQLAGDNDRRIVEKMNLLWQQGQPAPSAYRRVGNYSVFVFNAPAELEANQLIDQVKYEQVVQWLGDNPNWLKRAQKEYTETTLGVLVTVIKTSGLAAALCFGIGGFFGAVLFARRRAQQIHDQAYSDAGGMMRLNLDEMTAQTNPAKLIGPGSSEEI